MKARQVTMYTCERCGAPIKAVPDDPLVWTSAGKHCATCNGKLANAPSRDAQRAARVESASQSRGEAARKRWEAMTPEQKAERVAKLKAGRVRARAEAVAS